ncbi:ABC transporter substrate-binding protein [Geodermatophilus sp. SYSU D00815]
MNRTRRRSAALVVGAAVTSLVMSACGGDSGSDDGSITLSFLADNSETSVATAEALAEAFMEENPDITVEVETRPQGGEGDNIVKTRLSTGDMTDLFMYNSGSLFQALNPEQTLVPAGDAEWVDDLQESFTTAVTANDQVYGAPFGQFMGGAIMYHIPTYQELGLQIPRTWDQFMENNAAIQAAGKVPVIQTYGADSTWTSQLFVLGDFHNVVQEEPDFAEQYTAGEAKFADTPAALAGFQHLQEINEAGYLNEDFASATMPDGMAMLAAGEGVHYPILTFALATLEANNPEALNDVGLFPIPGTDEASNGLTVWAPGAVYIPATTEGEQLEAARQFQAFIASPAGCQATIEATPPQGPMAVDGCELPDDVPQVVKDIQTYVDQEGATTPALEFVSPIKGPALEQICVEVGSGIRSAEDGAALYDEDAKKQAQQLGIEGW